VQVKSAFAKRSIYDRLGFALAIWRSRTAQFGSRESLCPARGSVSCSPFSPVRFLGHKPRKADIFRLFCRNGRAEFSALQTAWRRAQSGA